MTNPVAPRPNNLPAARRRPKQQRSRSLVEAIVQACHQLLAEGGSEQLTTQLIAEKAGVTVGSLYQYFPNKEAIIADVFDSAIQTDADQIIRATHSRIVTVMYDDFWQTLRELVRMNAELYQRYLQLHGDFFRQYHLFFDFQAVVDRCAVERFQQPGLDKWLCWFLNHHRDLLVVDNIPLAAFISSQMIDRLTIAAIDNNPDWLQDEAYLCEIDRAVVGYLCGRVDAKPE